MPTPELVSEYRAARERYDAAAEALRAQLVNMAFATLSEVLPGATSIEAFGEYNEDWIPTLRIQRVRSADGEVLFDVDAGHPNRAVEDAVDKVDIEYLDVLIDITGDQQMGAVTIVAAERSATQ